MPEIGPNLLRNPESPHFRVVNMLMGGIVKALELGVQQQERAELAEESLHDTEMALDAMAQLAMIDPLTKLHNRAALDDMFWDLENEDLFTEEDRGRRDRKNAHSILILDLDYFKNINDTLGHDAGDVVLIEFAQLISDRTRESEDTPVRLGGEEFAIFVRHTDEAGALILAEDIRSRFEATGAGTVSIGVAEIVKGESLRTNLKRADDAMYMAKEQGRNKVISYSEVASVIPK